MWKLRIKQELEEDYKKKILPGLVKRVKNWGKKDDVEEYERPDIRSILLPDYMEEKPQKTERLEQLLLNKPQDAYDLNNELMAQIIKGYNEVDLEKKPRLDSYRVLDVLLRVFDYKGQISHSKSKSYWLAERIGHNTCTYCNRQYTFTVSGGNNNDNERITRPNFDHWFPESLFPLLSLNLYNLIPSCTICNSSAKGDSVFHLGEFVHPYTQEDENPDFRFVPAISDKEEGGWHVVLERDKQLNPAVDKTIEAFALDKIYDMHGPLEIKDLMDFAQAYNNTYLLTLFETTMKDLMTAGFSQEEVYRMLFGTESSPDRFLDRPLSKLKHDVLEYLHII